MSDTIDLRNPDRPIRVGVVLLDSRTEILDVAPVDLFAALSKESPELIPEFLLPEKSRGKAMDIEVHWVTEHGQDGKLTAGTTVKATHSFKTSPPLDIVLMGAAEMTYKMTPGEIAFLQKTHEHCHAFLFVCGGFMAGLQAGLLSGRTATGPRFMLQHLIQMHPDVNWVEKRWVHDGKIWTSGALLNGLDMTQAFAAEVWGAEEDSYVGVCLRLGAYPFRNVDYTDVPWKI